MLVQLIFQEGIGVLVNILLSMLAVIFLGHYLRLKGVNRATDTYPCPFLVGQSPNIVDVALSDSNLVFILNEGVFLSECMFLLLLFDTLLE